MTQSHRIRLPAPWAIRFEPDSTSLHCERWFQSPSGLHSETEVAIEIQLTGEYADQATNVSIAVNDRPLAVTRPADGRFEASLAPAWLMARNRLAVVFEGATDGSIVSASWIGLRLT